MTREQKKDIKGVPRRKKGVVTVFRKARNF